MRFTFATVGTRGDVQPLLAVALELSRRGHGVALCAPARFESWVRQHGVPFFAVGVDPEELLAAEKSPRRLRALMRADAQRQFEVLAQAAGGSDLVVGAGLVLAASSVAEALKIPFVAAAYAPQTLPSAEHPFPALPWMGLPPWVNRLSWRLGVSVYGWMTVPLLNEHRRGAGLAPHASPAQHMFGDDVLLASEPLFAGPPADARVAIEQTGAWHYQGPPLPGELVRFLDAGDPPVFVGFGSNRDEQRDRTIAEIVNGLRLAQVRGVIAGRRPERFSDDERIRFVDGVDFAQLFPRCALVVHHGGAGTTATAASAGRPQWIVAHRGDQHYWADRVDALRLGPASSSRRRFTAERLASAVRETLADAEGARRAREFASRMTPDGVRRAADALERRASRPPGV